MKDTDVSSTHLLCNTSTVNISYIPSEDAAILVKPLVATEQQILIQLVVLRVSQLNRSSHTFQAPGEISRVSLQPQSQTH